MKTEQLLQILKDRLSEISNEQLCDLHQVVSSTLSERFHPYALMVDPATSSSEIIPVVLPMESIPIDSNPFLHDDISSGIPIVNSWTIMYQTPLKDKNWSRFYMYNSESGQRFSVRMIPKELLSISVSFEDLPEDFCEEVSNIHKALDQ